VSLLVVLAAALTCAGGAAAAPQELTIAAADGTPLACALVEPDGSPPDGGWPGLLLFHGLDSSHADLEGDAETVFAPAGYASLMCDARGTGGSGGSFGLDGPAEVQDVRDLFAWLAARPEVSDTRIGAVGVSLGGGAVWNAAAAGVPFAAIVPEAARTGLATALAPQGLGKSGPADRFAAKVPTERWDPELAAARAALLGGGPLPAALGAVRSARARLAGLTVPTLIVQGRHDVLFGLDQALAAYGALTGPKRLDVADLGPSEHAALLAETVAWLDRFVRGERNGVGSKASVVLAHDPWDGTATSYPGLPPTRMASVTLPGRTTLIPGMRVSRGARLTGGPNETFGAPTVAVRYTGAHDWDRLVAQVTLAGSRAPIAVGGARVGAESGAVTIRLSSGSVRLPRERRLLVTVGATSPDGTYRAGVGPGARIEIGRLTLTLPLLRR